MEWRKDIADKRKEGKLREEFACCFGEPVSGLVWKLQCLSEGS